MDIYIPMAITITQTKESCQQRKLPFQNKEHTMPDRQRQLKCRDKIKISYVT